MTYADSYILDSGFESEYTMTVDSAYFAPEANFGGNTVLHIIGHKPDGDSRNLILSIGGDWESTDGGNTVTHAMGKTRFTKNSNYGHFLDAAVAIPELAAYLNEKGPATDARIWLDLTLDLEEKEIIRGGRIRATGEEIKPSRVMLPVAVRLPDQLPLPPAQEKPAPGPTPADILKAKAAAASNGASSISDQLATIARSSDTFDVFVEAAALMPEVLEDETLVADVVDASAAGFYHRTRSL